MITPTAVYRDRQDFSGHVFKDPAHFDNVVFEDEVDFSHATFERGANVIYSGIIQRIIWWLSG